MTPVVSLIVGVVVVGPAEISQFVMSCRVLGLEVEVAIVAALLDMLRQEGVAHVRAALVPTALNLMCRDLYARCGFHEAGEAWECGSAQAPTIPAHIAMHGVAELVPG